MVISPGLRLTKNKNKAAKINTGSDQVDSAGKEADLARLNGEMCE